jgi:nitrogen-specific signal transduction histidine kinase
LKNISCILTFYSYQNLHVLSTFTAADLIAARLSFNPDFSSFKPFRMNYAEDYPLQSLINSTAQSVVYLDKTCKVLFFNTMAEHRIRAYRKIRMQIGINFLECLCESTSERFLFYFKTTLEGQKSDIEVQLPIGDTFVWHSVGFFPVFDDNNAICGVSFVFNDIHEEKQHELKNIAYIEALESIAWRQSHLFRAPLANIKGLAELLSLQAGAIIDEDLMEMLRMLKSESDKLDNEIHSIVGLTNEIKMGKAFRN